MENVFQANIIIVLDLPLVLNLRQALLIQFQVQFQVVQVELHPVEQQQQQVLEVRKYQVEQQVVVLAMFLLTIILQIIILTVQMQIEKCLHVQKIQNKFVGNTLMALKKHLIINVWLAKILKLNYFIIILAIFQLTITITILNLKQQIAVLVLVFQIQNVRLINLLKLASFLIMALK